MLATHSPKMVTPRIKASAMRARILAAPDTVVCSANVAMQREVWAAPSNAADIARWRGAARDSKEVLVCELPTISDPNIKQLLLPMADRADGYVSITPVASMGLAHEIYRRLADQGLPYFSMTVQPNSAALANHGEALMLQGGVLRMLRRGVASVDVATNRIAGPVVVMQCRLESANIASGFVAVGLPAITGIGGFVHAIERKIGASAPIDFAVGIRSSYWNVGCRKIVNHRSSYGAFSGRAPSPNAPVFISPGFDPEVTGTVEVVLLLRGADDPEQLAHALRQASRLAGGSMFDVTVSIVQDGEPPAAAYVSDASANIRARCNRDQGIDALQVALDLYGEGGKWLNGQWVQPRNGATLLQSGFAFLESPISRAGSRNNCPHAWAEPVFSLVVQGPMTNSCWWSRHSPSEGVFWSMTKSD